ncbi:MAG: choice-of-anchor J domain-containing protein [Bacteroidaceae bacterium]
MRKGLITLFLGMAALLVQAQVKIPTSQGRPGKPNPEMQWPTAKPARKSHLVCDTPFRMPGLSDVSPRYTKSVGDGTQLFGNVLYADTWTSSYAPFGVYSLTASKGIRFDLAFADGDLSSPMAVYANGKFYSYRVSADWTILIECLVYDVSTGEYLLMLEPEGNYTNVPYSSAMTYDRTDGKVYAITYGEGGVGFNLSTMNGDASFTKLCALSSSFLTLAASPKGELFAISDEGYLVRIDKRTGAVTRVGDTGKSPKYAQSMAFDPYTGKLYWAFTNDDEAALYEVNTQTGKAYKIDDMPDGEQLVGLWVKPAAVANDAPAAVTDFHFTPHVEGGLTGTLSCTAPTKTYNGEALAGYVNVVVKSGDEVLMQKPAQAGETVSMEYTFDAAGLYTLYAVASNEKGSSVKNSLTVYVGEDRAGAPRNVQLNVQNGRATVTWEAPQDGDNGGHFDGSAISYKVTRCAGTADGVVVKTTGVGETSFSEMLPSATALYTYRVTSISQGVEGGTGVSNAVLSVGAYELPFYDNFDDGELCQQLYTYLDLDNDWDAAQKTNAWFWKSDEGLMQHCADGKHLGNDWLMTPAIHLDAKNLYTLAYTLNTGAPCNLRVTVGTSTDPKDHTIVVAEHKNLDDIWEGTYYKTVRVDRDANYYVGFYAFSGTEGYYMNLHEIGMMAGMSTALPDSVQNLRVEAAGQGVKRVDISYTAPTVLINGQPIEGSFHVKTYREDVVINDSEVTAGQTVSFSDNAPANGVNNYRVVALLNGEEGFSAKRAVWAGFDTPETVKNMSGIAIDGNMHVHLSWEAPTKGVSNGYFDISRISYSVWRGKDKSSLARLATGLKELKYTDYQVEQELAGRQDGFYYGVTAEVDDVRSEAMLVYVVAGTPYPIPAAESFPGGQFNIQPWTTQAVYGDYGFTCIKSDNEGGYPQDGDNGFVKFKSEGWSDYTDSRLKTPVFTLKGTENPSFSFFMYHIDAKSEDAIVDGGATKCRIEISVDGGAFQAISPDYTVSNTKAGWVEHRVSLADYKEAPCVKLALRGMTDNAWMSFYIDNIHIEEQADKDIAVGAFQGPKTAQVGDEAVYTLRYFNRGSETAAGYNIQFCVDGQVVKTQAGSDLKPGEIKDIELRLPVTAAYAGRTVPVEVKLDYAADGNVDNNHSSVIELSVDAPWYPTAKGLAGKYNGEGVVLTWNVPVLPDGKQPVTDGAEEYEPFAIEGFGDWISYDGDQLGSGGFFDMPDYPNKTVDQAWMVWAPGYLNGVTEQDWPLMFPRTGEQAFICWYANYYPDWESPDPTNDDWLISPQVSGGSEISFWIRRIHCDTDEKYEVMYSTTTQDPGQFKSLRSGVASDEWVEVKVALPADARYFAIHYKAQFQTGVMVDDITYIPAKYDLEVLGYNVYRDGVRLNESLLTEPTYTDRNVSLTETYAYQVSVVYNFGESAACSPLLVEPGNSIQHLEAGLSVMGEVRCIRIRTADEQPVVVYTADGKTVASVVVSGETAIACEPGVYVVRMNEHIYKVSVR